MLIDGYDSGLEVRDARSGVLLRRIEGGMAAQTLVLDPRGQRATVSRLCVTPNAWTFRIPRYGWWDPRRLFDQPITNIVPQTPSSDAAGCPYGRDARLSRSIDLACVAATPSRQTGVCAMTPLVVQPVTLHDDGTIQPTI